MQKVLQSVSTTVLILLVRLYRWVISPLFPPVCRFQPTCSQYAIEAIARFGAVRGSWLAMRRVIRCHPWHPGGYDPVPSRESEPPTETMRSPIEPAPAPNSVHDNDQETQETNTP